MFLEGVIFWRVQIQGRGFRLFKMFEFAIIIGKELKFSRWGKNYEGKIHQVGKSETKIYSVEIWIYYGSISLYLHT